MTTYTVTFDRIGRSRNVAPMTVQVEDADKASPEDIADGLAEVIYKYARPHLRSRDVEVVVDLDDLEGPGKGYIFCGFNNGGTFTVAVEEPAVTP